MKWTVKGSREWFKEQRENEKIRKMIREKKLLNNQLNIQNKPYSK
jgi:hypothetical protein